MDEITEILVVGAGAIGASCAAHLARGGHRVTVVDAQAAAAGGSTGRSFGAVRGRRPGLPPPAPPPAGGGPRGPPPTASSTRTG